MVTQIPRDQTTLPHAEQHQDPLDFHSGRFSRTQMGWSTLEKEAFAVVASIERSHWLASRSDGFNLFTDHNNLIFIFDPLSVMPDINEAATRKVLRWAVRLSAYNYVCCHIGGDDNIWADLLTRWSIPQTFRRLVGIPPLLTTFNDFNWLSPAALRASQHNHASSRPASAVLMQYLWHLPGPAHSNPMWVPDEDVDLQLRLTVIAHTGAAGHRGLQATLDAVRNEFFWTTISADVHLFVSSCILCLSTTGGGNIPRPFCSALHGTKPNDLIQFDYLEMSPRRSGEKYVLMVRDDHSGYCWLYRASSTDARTAAEYLVDWCAAFSAPCGLMSDGPTHFKNETMRLLTEGLGTSHHFTEPYCPWSNGAVERIGKEVLRIARAVLSELQMPKDDWPSMLPIFQSAFNNAPSPQRDNVAPITAFTDRPPSTPISAFLRSDDGTPVTLSGSQRKSTMIINTLVQHMAELHPKLHEYMHQQRERMRNVRSKGEFPNVLEGYYVLVAREEFFEGWKLCLRWRGPRRVRTALSDYVFKVEDFRNGKCDDIHGSRLKFYSDASLEEKLVLSHVLSSETGIRVSRLLNLCEDNGQLFVVVRLKGLPVEDDKMELLLCVYEDVPKLVVKMLARKNVPRNLHEKAHPAIGL